MEISKTEENYLKAIFSISSANPGQKVSTNDLSKYFKNRAASVTDMLKRLSDKKLIRYERYKPVELTAKGEKLAISIVRKHRLWEVFLVDKLAFSWDEVHDIAEQLEHIQSDELVNKLDLFLGKPRVDPHGDPIPDAKGQFGQTRSKPLSHFTKRTSVVFCGVSDHSKAFLTHLTSIGLKLGDTLHIEAIQEFDRSYKVKLRSGTLFLSAQVASTILVEVKK